MSHPRIQRRGFVLGSAALAVSALAPRSAEAAGSVDDALRAIEAARSGLRLLFAPFEQTRVIGLLASEVKSRGELTVLRPDRLRWELLPPDAVTYWIGPEGISYRSGDGKVARAPADARFGAILGDLLAFVAGDPSKLRERYELATMAVPTGLGLEAKPRTPDLKKLVSRLELVTNEEKWGLERIVIEEPTGDSSTMRFAKNEKNPALDVGRLKPPI
jgi:outer membrane lipoprotein-sorting protein